MRRGNSKLVIAVLIAIVSALGLTTYAIGAIDSDPDPIAPDGAFVGWQPQGSLSNDAGLAASAKTAWDEANPEAGPHTGVSVLFAGGSAEGGYGPSDGSGSDGTVVVLQGRDSDGEVSLAYLTDLDWWSGLVAPVGPLRLVAEQPLPSPLGVRAVGALVGSSGKGGPMAIGLAEPGGTVDGFTSPDWHGYSSGDQQSSLWLEVLPRVATAERTTLTAKRGGDVIHQATLEPNSFPAE